MPKIKQFKPAGVKTKYPTIESFEEKINKYKINMQNKPTIECMRIFLGLTISNIDDITRQAKKWNEKKYDELSEINKERYNYWNTIRSLYRWKCEEIISFIGRRIAYPPERVNINGALAYLKRVDPSWRENYIEKDREQVVVNVNYKPAGKNKL